MADDVTATEVQPDFTPPPNPSMPPPPTPDQSATAVPAVQHTRGERILEGVGSRAEAFAQGLSGLSGARPHDFSDSSVGRMVQQHYDARLAEARVNYNSAQQLLGILNANVDPDTGQALSPEKRAKYYQEANAAWGAYAKSAGVNKETKAAVAQKGQLFQLALTHGIEAAHQIATKLGLAGGGQGGQPQGGGSKGAPPPPSPGGGSAAPAASAAAAPAGAPPPPTYSAQNAAMDVPRLGAEAADRHALAIDQAKQDILTRGKVEEEKARTSNAATSKVTPASDAYFSLLDQIDPKTGAKYLPQDALKIVSAASAKAGKPTPFEEYMADPANYAKFEKEMTAAKASPSKSSSIGAVYGIYRMMEMGYKQNPEILPLVAQLAPQVFANAGMKVPPALTEALGKIPLDQPLSPTTGQPIGTSMPGAPTGATRNQAQTAARALTEIPDIRKEVDDLKGYLGPGEGRINVKYLLGKAGSTGDPEKDKKLSQLRTNLMFLSSAAAKFHLNSVRAMEEFETIADAGKDSSAALGGFLDKVEEWAKTAQGQESGYGERASKPSGAPPPPSPKDSSTSKFHRPSANVVVER